MCSSEGLMGELELVRRKMLLQTSKIDGSDSPVTNYCSRFMENKLWDQ